MCIHRALSLIFLRVRLYSKRVNYMHSVSANCLMTLILGCCLVVTSALPRSPLSWPAVSETAYSYLEVSRLYITDRSDTVHIPSS